MPSPSPAWSATSVRIPLQRSTEAPSQARARVQAEILGRLPQARVDEALLLTSEVVTNAFAHGEGSMTIAVECAGGAVLVKVTDQGPGLPMLYEADIDAESGRGLQLLDALATEWDVEAWPDGSGKTIWFTLA